MYGGTMMLLSMVIGMLASVFIYVVCIMIRHVNLRVLVDTASNIFLKQ